MPLIHPNHRTRCPICFEEFHLGEAHRRDVSPDPPNPQLDDFVGRFLAPTPPPLMGPVEIPPRRNSARGWLRRFWVPRDTDVWRKICPYCHMILPAALAQGELPTHIIALAGSMASGKSNFIAALVHTLRERYCREVGFAMNAQETFRVRDFTQVMSDVLYTERYGSLFPDSSTEARPVGRTQKAVIGPEIRIPLIYRMSFDDSGDEDGIPGLHPMDLALFDSAGEDTGDDLTTSRQHTRFWLAASGLIFVIDPLQYPDIYKLLDPEAQARNPRAPRHPEEAVNRFLNDYGSQPGKSARDQIATPVAFVLSKCDELWKFFPARSPIQEECYHGGGFNRRACYEVSTDLRGFLSDHGAGSLVKTAEMRFKDACYFATSAFGHPPVAVEEGKRVKSVDPFRIGDPLLWLFWKLGYIPERTDPGGPD